MPTTAITDSRALPISVRGVGRRFARDVLRGVDLEVAAGEIVAVLGPSGCGKSTLLRQIGGLDVPDSGSVVIDDSTSRLADQRCAIAFQEPRLLPWRTIRDNVALGLPKRKTDGSKPTKDENRTRVTELLDLVGLRASAHLRPREVSGGMAQRTSLARALAREPKVLLLDEPFGALDALTRLRMQDLLLDVHDELPTTVILVTHDVDEALYLADRIVLLDDLARAGGTPTTADGSEGGTGPVPTSIRRIVRVPGERRRDRDDPALIELRHELLADLGVVRSTAGGGSGIDSP
ncbi:ABC transporter ATP-binding protein [Frigoribacterium faeni]|uniref:ABC transporter n=1 Tax=Frigoribacterium faeni TaxID=145483 RepID=A0A7W3JHU7_9MICO|nr:ABC transporter ATP-binding protein [Frigoribacterium faeni]MBA8813157.1 sulfonate transport system ATP-binding protein [Frigoribacterium faeni]BFF14353.1 ABC transporter ATP-binding protein [Microbacterium flavescens]GEK84386.1 ABC transporter [Frigoribacterium faeni]